MSEPKKLDIPEYRSRVNTDILKLIPPDAGIVLEIGCGTGMLCEAFKRINPDVKWYGVEPDIKAADEASRRMAWAASLRVEELEFDFWSKELADVLILGDVLEHLEDPWYQLKRLSVFVKDNGQVLSSIPNASHFTSIVSLLQGQWPYADEGLFDRTHLRWFTLNSIRELFAQAGLQIFETRGRCFGNEHHGQFMQLVQSFGGWLGIDLKRLDRESRVLQFVVRAVKTVDFSPKIEPIHIHAILGEGCCARPRILEPMAMIETIPGVRCTIGDHVPDRPTITIQQRFRNCSIDLQKSLINCGSIIVYEIDDDPYSLQGIPETDFMALKAVHAVQCSTEPLAEVCRQWNPNVAVFQNMVAELPPPRVYEQSDIVKIFFGCQNRESDWAPIMDALNRVLSECYYTEIHVVHDQVFFNAINLPGSRKTFSPWLDYPEYRRMLRSCDIALLPLEPTRFNACKSDIGFIEAASEGATVLASQTAYQIQGIPGTCEIYKDPKHFEQILRWLIDVPDGRINDANINYNYVKNHRLLSGHYRDRLCWYQDLLARKAELDRSLIERVPELGVTS